MAVEAVAAVEHDVLEHPTVVVYEEVVVAEAVVAVAGQSERGDGIFVVGVPDNVADNQPDTHSLSSGASDSSSGLPFRDVVDDNPSRVLVRAQPRA